MNSCTFSLPYVRRLLLVHLHGHQGRGSLVRGLGLRALPEEVDAPVSAHGLVLRRIALEVSTGEHHSVSPSDDISVLGVELGLPLGSELGNLRKTFKCTKRFAKLVL